MIDDSAESPLSEEEMAMVRLNAERRLATWQSRGLYATGAFLVNSALIYMALYWRPLSTYRALLGKCLIPLAMVLLLVFLYCIGLWWGAWRALSDLEKGEGGTG